MPLLYCGKYKDEFTRLQGLFHVCSLQLTLVKKKCVCVCVLGGDIEKSEGTHR